MKIASAEQMRQIDNEAINHFGIPEIALMENAGHEIASIPLEENRGEIEIFLEKFIRQKQALIMNTEIFFLGKAELKKKLDLMDYINNNFKE